MKDADHELSQGHRVAEHQVRPGASRVHASSKPPSKVGGHAACPTFERPAHVQKLLALPTLYTPHYREPQRAALFVACLLFPLALMLELSGFHFKSWQQFGKSTGK